VLACESGEEGLQAASAARPDAALLDIQLPRASGFLVLEGLRALHGAIPVLAVTASVMDQDRRRILDAGFDAYVAKPVNIHQLLEILEDRLEQHKP
jgi:CheY-like chemotaxis protein